MMRELGMRDHSDASSSLLHHSISTFINPPRLMCAESITSVIASDAIVIYPHVPAPFPLTLNP
jgi:hypothetical protein